MEPSSMPMVLAALLLVGVPEGKPLKADVLLTNEAGTLFMRWQQGVREPLPNVQSARRGEPIAAVLVFSACGRDKQGNCNLTMDMVVLDPAGKVYGELKGTEVWVGKAAPSVGEMELGVGYMMIRIESKDPPGRYRIRAHINDLVTGEALDREQSFDVALAEPRDATQWPADRPKPNLAGFWKDHCHDDFGLKIAPSGAGEYSISFCGPGGCFEPGTYRPNSAIFGDDSYRVIDGDTLEVLGGDGFSTYSRCPAAAPQ